MSQAHFRIEMDLAVEECDIDLVSELPLHMRNRFNGTAYILRGFKITRRNEDDVEGQPGPTRRRAQNTPAEQSSPGGKKKV